LDAVSTGQPLANPSVSLSPIIFSVSVVCVNLVAGIAEENAMGEGSVHRVESLVLDNKMVVENNESE